MSIKNLFSSVFLFFKAAGKRLLGSSLCPRPLIACWDASVWGSVNVSGVSRGRFSPPVPLIGSARAEESLDLFRTKDFILHPLYSILMFHSFYPLAFAQVCVCVCVFTIHIFVYIKKRKIISYGAIKTCYRPVPGCFLFVFLVLLWFIISANSSAKYKKGESKHSGHAMSWNKHQSWRLWIHDKDRSDTDALMHTSGWSANMLSVATAQRGWLLETLPV